MEPEPTNKTPKLSIETQTWEVAVAPDLASQFPYFHTSRQIDLVAAIHILASTGPGALGSLGYGFVTRVLGSRYPIAMRELCVVNVPSPFRLFFADDYLAHPIVILALGTPFTEERGLYIALADAVYARYLRDNR